jgi:hypothetical protein
VIEGNAELGLLPAAQMPMTLGSNSTRSTAMSTPRDPDSTTSAEPPTIEELRLKLAQYAVDAQRAELQRHIRQLADAANEREAEAA